jgi:hypothetical protein
MASTSREAFGPNLRRLRLRRGVPLEAIATATNVPIQLWESLEDNDLYGWPNGLLARAYVREYARHIGIDPDETVDEFCRLFPHGDRRRDRIMAEVAASMGEPFVAGQPVRVDRRAAANRRPRPAYRPQPSRLVATGLDAAIVATLGELSGVLGLPFGYPTRLLFAAAAYLAACSVAGHRSLGSLAASPFAHLRKRS